MRAGKYLLFDIDKKLFGLLYSEVLEVGTIENSARIPFSSEIISEVFNHHGKVIPILDLPALLGLPEAERNNFLLVRGDEYNISFAIGSILGIEESNEILKGKVPEEYVKHIIKIFDRRVYVIDTERIFNKLKQQFKEE